MPDEKDKPKPAEETDYKALEKAFRDALDKMPGRKMSIFRNHAEPAARAHHEQAELRKAFASILGAQTQRPQINVQAARIALENVLHAPKDQTGELIKQILQPMLPADARIGTDAKPTAHTSEAAAATTTAHADGAAASTAATPRTKVPELKGFWRKFLVGTPAAATGIALGATTGPYAIELLKAIPILGKVPGVATALNAVGGSLTPLLNYLGLQTGSAATTSLLSYLPLGTTGALGGLIAIPGAAYALGKMKSWITREDYEGLFRPMWEAAKTPFQPLYIVPWAIHKTVMDGPRWVKNKVKKAGKTALNWTNKSVIQPFVLPAVKWSVPGVIIAGSVGLGAAFTGSALSPALGVGGLAYLAGNFINHKFFKGGHGTASAQPAHVSH